MVAERDEGVGKEFSELLDKARSGDRNAWDALFSRLADEHQVEGAAILSVARKVLPRHHWARDLVESRDILQSALRVGWIHANQFHGRTENEFFAWLKTILRNKASRATRRQDARAKALGGEIEEAAAPPVEGERDPLAPIMEEEVRARVRTALEQLPGDQRSVMELLLKGFKAPEIARMLGLKPATVRKRESRAKERLRELLE